MAGFSYTNNNPNAAPQEPALLVLVHVHGPEARRARARRRRAARRFDLRDDDLEVAICRLLLGRRTRRRADLAEIRRVRVAHFLVRVLVEERRVRLHDEHVRAFAVADGVLLASLQLHVGVNRDEEDGGVFGQIDRFERGDLHGSPPPNEWHLCRHDGHEEDVGFEREIGHVEDGFGYVVDVHSRLRRFGSVCL